jgi:hypothetical protein
MQWSVAIFSSRETIQTLSAAINAVFNATNGVATTIDVIVNGNRSLATETSHHIEELGYRQPTNAFLRVWYIPLADKAHSWNQYLHNIWRPSEIAFFVDGYVEVMPDALKLMSDGLEAKPKALAASGVPSVGRSAKKLKEMMLTETGIHGNLHALRGSSLEQLRAESFTLPLGFYRVDGLIGALVCFGLDPASNEWDSTRILVQPKATWMIRPLNWKSPKDIRSHGKRVVRQAQGVLENMAVREHLAVQKKSPQSLPQTSAELVGSWTRAFPRTALGTFIRNPFCLIAWSNLRRPRDWSQVSIPPLLLCEVMHD